MRKIDLDLLIVCGLIILIMIGIDKTHSKTDIVVLSFVLQRLLWDLMDRYEKTKQEDKKDEKRD